MSENLSCFECCSAWCLRRTSSRTVNVDAVDSVSPAEGNEDQQTASKEDHTDAQDPDMAKHRLLFLDFNTLDREIHSAQDLHDFDEHRVSVIYGENPNVAREKWNSGLLALVAKKRVTDLRLQIQPNETDEEAPDFAVLLQCPLKSLTIETLSNTGYSSIPQAIIAAFEMLSALEALTVVHVKASGGLVDVLNSDRFPNLCYLHVNLDNDVDFRKLPQLKVLRLVAKAVRYVDLRSLADLRALEVESEQVTVVQLAERCSRLEWLHILGDAEINGDVSEVTHLLLGEYTIKASDPMFGSVSRFRQLRQLTLKRICCESNIAIPASVERLFIEFCQWDLTELPAEKVFEVLSLNDVSFTSNGPTTLRATHLRLCDSTDPMVWSGLAALRETFLGSPKSLAVECVDGNAFLRTLFEKEDFRRDIQFFATDMPLKTPLPAMPALRELCLPSFADVEQIREIGKPTRLEKLFISGSDDPPFDNWKALRLQDISKSLQIPGGLWVPETLGLTVERPIVPSENEFFHAKLLWGDHVRRSTGEFDVYSTF